MEVRTDESRLMPDATFDVVVVGAGPAGLAAACRAAESGARVALVDDNPKPGGQIWRADPAQWQPAARQTRADLRSACLRRARAGRLALEKFDGDLEIGYRNLILATGARERFLPFPGWTLPNVMGAGGLQALAKSGLPIEGKKVIVAGSGPLLLAVAKYMRSHGAELRLIAEQASDAALFRFGLGLAAIPGSCPRRCNSRATFLGIRYLTACWPVAAEGTGKLESVTL